MRQDLYDWVQSYPGGVSAFFEDAIKEFKGTLEELVAAGVRFEDTRRVGQGVVGPVNGRVPPALKQRTVDMLQAAKNARVKRASHSKIIAGYVQLAIERMQVQNEGAPASMEE